MIHGRIQLQRDTEKITFKLYNHYTLYGYSVQFCGPESQNLNLNQLSLNKI